MVITPCLVEFQSASLAESCEQPILKPEHRAVGVLPKVEYLAVVMSAVHVVGIPERKFTFLLGHAYFTFPLQITSHVSSVICGYLFRISDREKRLENVLVSDPDTP